MAVWVYDEEIIRVDHHRTWSNGSSGGSTPFCTGGHMRPSRSVCARDFGRVPRANWARRPLHAQSYNFPAQLPTRQATASAHQTDRAHTQSRVVWWSGGLVVRCSGRWVLNQHAHPLLSRQKGASLTQRATYVSNKRPHNYTARNPSEFHIKNLATSVPNQ